MKKILAMMLAALMLTAMLAGCGAPADNTGDTSPSPESPKLPTPLRRRRRPRPLSLRRFRKSPKSPSPRLNPPKNR